MPYVESKFILDIIPKNMALDVALNSTISVIFGRDIDPDTVNHLTFQVHKLSNNDRITGTITYNARVATFVPNYIFEPGETYRVILLGEHGPNSPCIRDISDTPMAADFNSTFTTTTEQSLLSPITVYPEHQTIVVGDHVKFVFALVDGADHYELVLCNSSDDVVWHTMLYPIEDLVDGNLLSATAGPFSEGEYFWKVRAYSLTNLPGSWSEVKQFVLKSSVEVIPSIQEPGILSVVSSIPSDGDIDVLPTSVIVKFNRSIDKDTVTPDRFYIYKRKIY